jgi:hypothetical protein
MEDPGGLIPSVIDAKGIWKSPYTGGGAKPNQVRRRCGEKDEDVRG